jgi:exo-beta-1,3-glucanase (GH17 family)
MQKTVWVLMVSGLIFSVLVGCSTLVGCGGEEGPPPPVVTYQLHGLCFSPYLELDPNQGATVSVERITSLLNVVAPYCQWIRTFGATHGLERVPSIAKSKGLKVAAACWLSRNQSANTAEVNSLINSINEGNVDLAIVGTEVLLRNDLTEDQLIAYIRQVKATGVLTTTNDTWSELLSHPAVLAECDVVMANFYPYWEGVAIQDAVKTLHANYLNLQQSVGDKEIIVGETGWPSDGNAVGEAVPSQENASFYFLNLISWARAEDVKSFYFEAFDEPWKEAYEGPQGAHWGIWDFEREMKSGMIRVFNGETVPDNWSAIPPTTYNLTVNSGSGSGYYAAGTVVNIVANAPPSGQVFDKWVINAGAPTIADVNSASTTLTMPASDAIITATYKDSGPPHIEFTYVPPYGSFANLKGKVTGVNPSDYKVAVYIYVGGWWTKPYWSSPLTTIQSDGTWTCDITTGGQDQNATKIAAYLVPNGYNPPLMYGGQTLPDELEQNSVAKVEVTRLP